MFDPTKSRVAQRLYRERARLLCQLRDAYERNSVRDGDRRTAAARENLAPVNAKLRVLEASVEWLPPPLFARS